MAAQKRARGRPKGTGINDEPMLRKMAALIEADPCLKPTTALKKVERRPRPSTIRRIQIKWRRDGRRLMADLHARRASARTTCVTSVASQYLASLKQAAKMARAHATIGQMLGVETLAARALRELQESAAVRLAMYTYNSPATQMAREMHNSPSARMARDLYNSPSARMARDMYNSPEIRMMRELRDAMSGSWLE